MFIGIAKVECSTRGVLELMGNMADESDSAVAFVGAVSIVNPISAEVRGAIHLQLSVRGSNNAALRSIINGSSGESIEQVAPAASVAGGGGGGESEVYDAKAKDAQEESSDDKADADTPAKAQKATIEYHLPTRRRRPKRRAASLVRRALRS